jgi:hypothetical protein
MTHRPRHWNFRHIKLVNILIVLIRFSFYFSESSTEKILKDEFSEYVQDEPGDTGKYHYSDQQTKICP